MTMVNKQVKLVVTVSFSLFFKVPFPVALFPLNAAHGTNEVNNRVTNVIPSGVNLAAGPNGEADGSYEFYGSNNSYIEIPNSAGEPLDVRHSMTMLCWVYHDGQDGPLFNYKTRGRWAVHLWVVEGQLFVRFTRRDYSLTTNLQHTSLAGGWKFVGASYDRGTGVAKLWVNGAAVHTLNIGAGLDLATQDSIRMGAKIGDERYFRGRIAQMQVYDKALSQEQIFAIQEVFRRVVGEYVTNWKKRSTEVFCNLGNLQNFPKFDKTTLLRNTKFEVKCCYKKFSGRSATLKRVLKLNRSGTLVTMELSQCEGGQPHTFSKNYPNSSTRTVKLRFHVIQNGRHVGRYLRSF